MTTDGTGLPDGWRAEYRAKADDLRRDVAARFPSDRERLEQRAAEVYAAAERRAESA